MAAVLVLTEDALEAVLSTTDVTTMGRSALVCHAFLRPARKALQCVLQLSDAEMVSLRAAVSGATEDKMQMRLAALALPLTALTLAFSGGTLFAAEGHMLVRHVQLENWMRFSHLEMGLSADATFIVGDHGVGKSALLAAVVLAFSPRRLQDNRYRLRRGGQNPSEGCIRLLLMLPMLTLRRPAVLECRMQLNQFPRWTLNGSSVSWAFVEWLGQFLGVHDQIHPTLGSEWHFCSSLIFSGEPLRYGQLMLTARLGGLDPATLQQRHTEIQNEFARLLQAVAIPARTRHPTDHPVDAPLSGSLNFHGQDPETAVFTLKTSPPLGLVRRWDPQSLGPAETALVVLALVLAARAPGAALQVLEDPFALMGTHCRGVAWRMVHASLEAHPCQLIFESVPAPEDDTGAEWSCTFQKLVLSRAHEMGEEDGEGLPTIPHN